MTGEPPTANDSAKRVTGDPGIGFGELLGDFTMEQKRNFVMRHTLQLQAWQQPDMQSEYRRYVAEAPEDWINKSFMQFAEMYEYDKNAITPRCAAVA